MSEKRYQIRCAVYVFIIKNSKLFLLRRKNTGWEDGKYSTPGGHLELNESITQAAIREAKEEAGIDIKGDDLHLIHTMHRKDNYDYIDLFFSINKWENEPFLAEKDRSDDAQWFPIDKLPQNMLKHQKAAFENYQNNIVFSEFGWN